MKLLKIENSLGHYLNETGQYNHIDKITKEDLLRLVDLALKEEVVFDEYDESVLQHSAHQIVYKSILDKLDDLNNRKGEFKDTSERMFLDEHEKYKDVSS